MPKAKRYLIDLIKEYINENGPIRDSEGAAIRKLYDAIEPDQSFTAFTAWFRYQLANGHFDVINNGKRKTFEIRLADPIDIETSVPQLDTQAVESLIELGFDYGKLAHELLAATFSSSTEAINYATIEYLRHELDSAYKRINEQQQQLNIANDKIDELNERLQLVYDSLKARQHEIDGLRHRLNLAESNNNKLQSATQRDIQGEQRFQAIDRLMRAKPEK